MIGALTLLCLVGIALQVLDYASTRLVIERGRGAEGNPLIAWLIDRIGHRPALVIFKLLVVGCFVFLWIAGYGGSKSAIWVVAGLDALYVFVVLRNLKIAGSR